MLCAYGGETGQKTTRFSVSDEGVGHDSLDEPMEECVTQGGEGILSF